MPEEPIQITLRDVYDLVLDQGTKITGRLDDVEEDLAAHLASDVNSFADIRIKLYGVGAGILALLTATLPILYATTK